MCTLSMYNLHLSPVVNNHRFRYFKQSLVIRGPGAGADVTAGGVFGDLLRLAAYLGAPS